MNKPLQLSPVSGPARWLGLIAGAVMLLSAVFLGAVLFVIVAGAVIVLGSVVAVRLWWQRRRLNVPPSRQPRGPEQGRIIDAEYSVVDEDDR